MSDDIRPVCAAAQQGAHAQQHRPHVAAGVVAQVHDPAAAAAVVLAPEVVLQAARVLPLRFPLPFARKTGVGQEGTDVDQPQPRVDRENPGLSGGNHGRGHARRSSPPPVSVAYLFGRPPPAMTGSRAIDGIGQQGALPVRIGGHGKIATQRRPVDLVAMQRLVFQEVEHLLAGRQRRHRSCRGRQGRQHRRQRDRQHRTVLLAAHLGFHSMTRTAAG